MESKLRRWELGGFVFTCVAGTLLHFAYDFSGENVIIGAFSAVNESVWEHMKLLFLPLFLVTLAEMAVFADRYKNFWTAKAVGTLLGLVLIPVIYYTYTGAFGVSLMWVDVALFFFAATVAFWSGYRRLKRERQRGGMAQIGAMLLLWGIALLFVWFTYDPPHIPLFQDPVTLAYGLE